MTHDPQMLKGVLSLLLLRLLADREDYGYAIVTRLREAGFPGLTEGTVYPALSRLESSGLLSSSLRPSGSGPARKYYRTTDAGTADLAARTRSWHELVASVGRAGVDAQMRPGATGPVAPATTRKAAR